MTDQTSEELKHRAGALAHALEETLRHYVAIGKGDIDKPHGEGLIHTIDIGQVVAEVTPDEIHISTGSELTHVEVYRSVGVCARRIAHLHSERHPINRPIGLSLRKLRERHGVAQTKLAAYFGDRGLSLGATQSYVAKVERGYKTDDSLVDIHRYLAGLDYRLRILTVGNNDTAEIYFAPKPGPVGNAEDDRRALNTTIGTTVKSIREDRGLTGSALAEALGVKQPFISKLEAGEVNWQFNRLRFYLQRFGYGINLSASPVKGPSGHSIWSDSLAPEAPYAWLGDLYGLVEKGKIDWAIDLLFDRVNDLLFEDQFDRVNNLLHVIDLDRLDVDLLVALLSITLPAREKLPGRAALVGRVETRLLVLTPDDIEGHMSGLR